MDFFNAMDTESDYDDNENDDTELIGLIMNEKRLPVRRKEPENTEKRMESEPELIHLNNAPFSLDSCGDEGVNTLPSTSNDLTRCNVADNDDNEGREIIREIDLIVPANEFSATGSCRLDDVIVNCIRDENVKNELFRLNERLEKNIDECRKMAAEAKNVISKKLALTREYKALEERISKYSVEEAKLKKIKKKKGQDCAVTGNLHITYFRRFGIPYFKTRQRFAADRNLDYEEIVNSNQILLSRLPKSRRFLRNDAEILDRLILSQLKTKRIQVLKSYQRKLVQNEEDEDENESDALHEKERKIREAIMQTSRVDSINDTVEWNIPVDFMSLIEAQNYRFTAEDYERIWNLLANPRLTREDFSDEEVVELKRLVRVHGAQDWEKIADLLNTNRSGFMCFAKYVSLEKKGRFVSWTPEEDRLLRNLCAKLCEIGKSGSRYHWWRNIRRHFPNRTYNQLHARWTYVLSPKLKKGRFSDEEHKIVETMVKQGKSFKEIAKIIPTRSCIQIRSHYEHKIETRQQTLNSGPWTPEESNLFIELVKKYGEKNWVAVSRHIKTRNRTQCRLKYLQFKKTPQHLRSDTGELRKGRWTIEENELYTRLLAKHGTNWTRISEEMKTRSSVQCRLKYAKESKLKDANKM